MEQQRHPKNTNFNDLFFCQSKQSKEEMIRQVDKAAVEAAQKEVEKILSEMHKENVKAQPFSLGILGENFWSILTIVLVSLWVSGVSTISLWASIIPVFVPIVISLGIHGFIKIVAWRAKREMEGKK